MGAPMSGLQIGFVLFPNLTQLDFTGPLRSCRGYPNSTTSSRRRGRPCRPTPRSRARADDDLSRECPPIDLLCIPGG